MPASAPSVLIAANPYEGELCKRALAELGLEVELADSVEGALAQLAAGLPLVVVIADGWFGGDARELLVEVRAGWNALPIFLVADRDGDIADEAAAIRRGASRLFFRPIDAESLAIAIERVAVEAERDQSPARPEPAEAITERSPATVPVPVQVTVPAPPRVEILESAPVEIDAASELEWDEAPRPVGIPLPRISTEVVPAPGRSAQMLAAGGVPEHEALLRADEALAEAAGLRLPALATSPDLRVELQPNTLVDAPTPPVVSSRDAAFSDRSTFARRLDRELSEAERRLFPGSSPIARPAEDYQGALDDIDLDALGFDTVPGIGPENGVLPASRRNGADHAAASAPVESHPETSPLSLLAGDRSVRSFDRPLERARQDAPAAAAPPPVDEEGSLAEQDISELVGRLYAAGYSGRLSLERDDGQKQLFFEAGCPVFATSTFAHDRLGDQLHREGKLSREQHARTRELLVEPGRRTAVRLVELGLLKARELYPTLRRHVEEIFYSSFAWDSGHYRLDPEPAPPEDRLRLSAHPWALLLEGIRRKYGLERLTERLGGPDTVLAPTTSLERALEACELAPPERMAAELVDGVRTLAEIESQVAALRSGLGEVALYALLFGLTAIGAARRGADEAPVDVRAASTLVTHSSALERRAGGRDSEARPNDRAVDRERLLAKRTQIGDADYFTVLGLGRDATTREIDRAFVRLRADFAPDRFAETVRDELALALSEIGEVLAEAHRVLMDEGVRDAYRSHLDD